MSAAVMDAPPPPFVEIVQIHQCLRVEVTELANLIARALTDVSLRAEVERRFAALKSIYESHSKAEDEIIFPELQARGLSPDACAELDKQHDGQHDAFLRLEEVLRSWSEDVVELADQLRASVVLHLRMEEEELLPLLGSNFQKQELGFLVGKVIGDRSSEIMEAIIHMLSRNLPPEMVQNVLSDFKQAACNTHFSEWIDSAEGSSSVNAKPELLSQVRLSPDQGAFVSMSPSGALGCTHYQRGVKIWTSCCQKLYPCIRCHDEAVQFSHRVDLTGHHAWCMTCGAVQSNPGNKCANCDALFGKYTCRRCGIWESNPSAHVYHCPYCDVCRIGTGLGTDFFHCMRCNACVSTKMRFHKCVEGTLDRECPVCCEALFSTTKPVQYVRCGHVLHKECFQNYLSHDYRCATCRCSMIDMSSTWKKLEELSDQSARAGLQTPSQFSSRFLNLVRCNDCGLKTAPSSGPISSLVQAGLVNLRVGEKCTTCGSFNTI